MKRVLAILAVVVALGIPTAVHASTVFGPIVAVQSVPSGDFAVRQITFYGNELAQIRVHSTGMHLSVGVLDSNGNVVDFYSYHDADGYLVGSWVPSSTQVYTLVFTNTGLTDGAYSVATN